MWVCGPTRHGPRIPAGCCEIREKVSPLFEYRVMDRHRTGNPTCTPLYRNPKTEQTHNIHGIHVELQLAATRVVTIGPAAIDHMTQPISVRTLRHIDAEMRSDSTVNGRNLAFRQIADRQSAKQDIPAALREFALGRCKPVTKGRQEKVGRCQFIRSYVPRRFPGGKQLVKLCCCELPDPFTCESMIAAQPDPWCLYGAAGRRYQLFICHHDLERIERRPGTVERRQVAGASRI